MQRKTIGSSRPDNPDETYNWILQHKNTFDKFKDVQFYKVNKKAKQKWHTL